MRSALVKNIFKKFTIWFLFIGLFVFAIYCSYLVFKTIPIQKTELNNVFYIFSTAAQTIAALVGFVLAAYTFNHQLVSSQKDEQDEARNQVIESIIQKNYRQIVILSIMTGITLILDLFVLELNGVPTTNLKEISYIIVGSLNVVLIIFAVIIALFTIKPIDTTKEAQKLFKAVGEEIKESLDNKKGHLKHPEDTMSSTDFIQKFIEMEKSVREYLIDNDLYNDKRLSMGKMITILYEQRGINHELFHILNELSRYRNLVVHGHVTEIDKDMYESLLEAYKNLVITLEINR
jgi:uncharacterized protein YutE (UPF0331/DUF86 family)